MTRGRLPRMLEEPSQLAGSHCPAVEVDGDQDTSPCSMSERSENGVIGVPLLLRVLLHFSSILSEFAK